MNSDEYYKHYLEETMGKKKPTPNKSSVTNEKKQEESSSSKWLLLLFFLGLLAGLYYIWQNKNHADDTPVKETVIEKPQNIHVEEKLKKEKLAEKREAEKAHLLKLAQEKEQKILKAKQLETDRIAKEQKILKAKQVEAAHIAKEKEEKIRAEKEAKAKQEAKLAQIAAEKKLKALQEKAKAKAREEAKARIAQIEAKKKKESNQKEEAKRKKEKNDSLDQKVVDAQAGIGNLEQALLSGIKKSKSTPLKNTKKVDTFNKVVVKKEKTVQKQSTTSKAEEALKMVMKNSHKTNKNNYTSALKVEAKTREEEMQYVTVKEGDTLFDIAKRIYGDAMKYPLIFGANPDILNDPARISIGQKLRVPKVKETL